MDAFPKRWRFLIDANTQHQVGAVLEAHGHDVLYVNEALPPASLDDTVDQFARVEKRIIVSHDNEFMRKVQQKLFQFHEPLTTGYGRIMLVGRESRQPGRIEAALPFIELCYRWCVENERRLLLIIGDHFIPYDDQLIPRTPRQSRNLPALKGDADLSKESADS